MSDLIRVGLRNGLQGAVQRSLEVARNEKASAAQRLRAVEFLRLARLADAAEIMPLETMERMRRDVQEEKRFRRSRQLPTQTDSSPRPRVSGPPRSEPQSDDDAIQIVRAMAKHHPAPC